MSRVVLVIAAALGIAAAPPPGRAERGLLAAEDARAAAEVGHDAAALAQALADDLVFVHASGLKEGKAEHLRSVAAETRMRGARFTERTARIDGRTGITHGIATFDMAGTPRVARYLAVYRRESGRWQLAAWVTVGLRQPG